MNVFQMYLMNGYRADFWVRRSSWRNCVALVTLLNGKPDGPLPNKRAPYFGDPSVDCEMWRFAFDETEFVLMPSRFKGGEPTKRFAHPAPHAGHWERVPSEGPTLLSCPGTYQYNMIRPPDLTAKLWDADADWNFHPLEYEWQDSEVRMAHERQEYARMKAQEERRAQSPEPVPKRPGRRRRPVLA